MYQPPIVRFFGLTFGGRYKRNVHIGFYFLKFYGESYFELFRHRTQFFFQDAKGAVSCTVARINGCNAGFFDLFRQLENFFISFVEQVKAADQRENSFCREGFRNLIDNVCCAGMRAGAENDESFFRIKDEALFMDIKKKEKVLLLI